MCSCKKRGHLAKLLRCKKIVERPRDVWRQVVSWATDASRSEDRVGNTVPNCMRMQQLAIQRFTASWQVGHIKHIIHNIVPILKIDRDISDICQHLDCLFFHNTSEIPCHACTLSITSILV